MSDVSPEAFWEDADKATRGTDPGLTVEGPWEPQLTALIFD